MAEDKTLKGRLSSFLRMITEIKVRKVELERIQSLLIDILEPGVYVHDGFLIEVTNKNISVKGEVRTVV